jgi:uncharacterized alkaline shock family protein YloU
MSKVAVKEQPEVRDEPQSEEHLGELFGELPAESAGQPAGSPEETPAPASPREPEQDALPFPGAAAGFDAPTANMLRGRIKVADEVVEKVAALAALEIPGVADLGGDFERALESVRGRVGIGTKRATQGVQAKIQEGQVTVDVTIVIVYGHVVMDVATKVKVNVAKSVSHMLGMQVTEVNVTVDDVRLSGESRPTS